MTGELLYVAADSIKRGKNTGSYAAADRIKSRRKDRKLCSCRQDTRREERQGARQLQTGDKEEGKKGSCAAAHRI